MPTIVSERSTSSFNPSLLVDSKKAVESLVTRAVEQAVNYLAPGESLAFSVACVESSGTFAMNAEKPHALSCCTSAKRATTWARGRAAARTAVGKLGFKDPGELAQGSGGEPVWPDGICGSITHCHPWSVAVAMRFSRRMSLGIDMENMDRISNLEIAPLVCRSSEYDWILAGNDPYRRLCMIFSGKEALYKSLYPWHQRYIDFTEVELSWCSDLSAFRAVLFTNESNKHRALLISSERHDNLIVSCSAYTLQ